MSWVRLLVKKARVKRILLPATTPKYLSHTGNRLRLRSLCRVGVQEISRFAWEDHLLTYNARAAAYPSQAEFFFKFTLVVKTIKFTSTLTFMHKNTGMFMPVWSTSLCMLNYIYFLPLFHMGKNHGTMCEIPLVLYLLTYKQRLWKLVPFDFQDNLMHGLTKKSWYFTL